MMSRKEIRNLVTRLEASRDTTKTVLTMMRREGRLDHEAFYLEQIAYLNGIIEGLRRAGGYESKQLW